MKFLPVTLAGLALWCACVGADDRVPGKARAAQQALGEQFVASLRDDNIVAYSQCWLSGAIISRSECDAAEPDEEHLAWLRKSLPVRDLEIARQFEFLRDRLKDLAGSVSSVKLESVRLDPRDAEDVTLETSNTLYLAPALGIVLRVDPDTLVEISVEGATGTADRWWLTRSAGEMGALRITRRGKARFVNIMTAKEQFLFSIPPFTIKRAPGQRPAAGRRPSKGSAPVRPETADEGRRFLGGRLVQSLRDGNLVAYAQCWESAKGLLHRAGVRGGKNGPLDLAKLSGELAARDVRISRQFDLLRDRFKELTKDLSSLRIESVSGGPMNSAGPTDFPPGSPVTGATISREPPFVVRVDRDTVVEIPVDSAHAEKFGDYWYFTGAPDTFLKVTQRGKSRLVNILTGRPAARFRR